MSAPATTRRRSSAALLWALRIAGAALLAAIAAIHLYLWTQGYDGIDVIGPAFLLQSVLGLGGALLVLVTPVRWLPWAAALGAAFAAGSLAALLLSTTVGLFGFVESTSATYWWESFWAEVAGVVVLTALALTAARHRRR
ncbi:hypothetical protein [Blastococcus sp. SYSU D00820]